MAILDIIEEPHPLLTKRARPVEAEEFGAKLAQHLEDMAETMYAAPGVGLAAPQVADSRRILVADPGNEDDEDDTSQLVMMVNPEILNRSRQTVTTEESCLSVPEFYMDVKRADRIQVRWQDAQGTFHEQAFEGFPSIVVQHEMDHLDGVTLLKRASRFKRSRYLSQRRKRRRR